MKGKGMVFARLLKKESNFHRRKTQKREGRLEKVQKNEKTMWKGAASATNLTSQEGTNS